MNINSKTVGSLLVGFSIILLFLLTFVKIDNDKKSAILCQEFSKDGLDMKDCPVHKSNFSWIIILSYGISFIVLAIGVILLFIPRFFKEESKKEFKQFDISKLSEEEKKFYDIIKNKGGSSYQTDLINETSFSKVKTTRILDRMESRGMVERKRRGMTNIIVLK